MGSIDTHSEHSLYDVLDGSLGMSDQGRGYAEPEGAIDFYGFHICPANNSGKYQVQYDGHVGTVDKFEADEFGDVLELVDRMMGHVFEAQHYDYQDNKEALVDWAGKIMTSDEEQADEHPELYIHIPEEPLAAE